MKELIILIIKDLQKKAVDISKKEAKDDLQASAYCKGIVDAYEDLLAKLKYLKDK